MGSAGGAFRAIPRWIRLLVGFPKMPKLRMFSHFYLGYQVNSQAVSVLSRLIAVKVVKVKLFGTLDIRKTNPRQLKNKYSMFPNKRAVLNKRTGWNFRQ